MKFIRLILVALMIWSCAEVYYPPDPVVYKSKILRVFVSRVKDKGDKFHVISRLDNETDKPILVLFGGLACFKGKTEGLAKYSFGIGEQYINIPPGSSKPVKFWCELNQPVPTGHYRVVIKKVFSNPSGDGRTPGKAIAENLSFEI